MAPGAPFRAAPLSQFSVPGAVDPIEPSDRNGLVRSVREGTGYWSSDASTTSDARGSFDARGPSESDFASYPLEETGLSPKDFREDRAEVDAVFEWRLGESRSGEIDTYLTYVPERAGGGCGCSNTGGAPKPIGAALLFAVGCVVLRRRAGMLGCVSH